MASGLIYRQSCVLLVSTWHSGICSLS